MTRLVVVGVALALIAAAPVRSRDSILLRYAECRDAPPRLSERIAGAWRPWIPFIQQCPVFGPRGHQALSILTVRIDLVVAARVPDSWPIPFPHALILDVNNATIGELAAAVPDGPPGTTIVIFSDWRNDFPHRIDVRQINAAVSGTYNEKPLVWNAGRRRYE